MAYELPEQLDGLNLSATPTGPPPPGVGVTAPTPTQAARTEAPTPTWGDRIGQIGTVLEAFGSGYKGQEPLFLKLRRQQAVEEQQRTDRKLKVQQFEMEQQKRNDAVFQQGVNIAMDDSKPIETRIAALEGMSRQNPGIAALKPLITKQVLQDLPMAKDYLSPDVMKAIEGIQRNPNGKVDFPGGLTGIAAEIKNSAEFGRADVKEKGANIKEQQLKDRYDKGVKLSEHEQQFLVDRDTARKKLDLEFKALGLTNKKLTADTKVAEDTVKSRIAEAAQQAAPRMREYISGKDGTVVTQEFVGGRWQPLASGVKAPSISVKIGEGERKDITEERATLRGIDRLLKTYETSFTGPINNIWNTLGEKTGLIGEKKATWRKELNQLVSLARRIDYGTAQSAGEIKQIAVTYPDVGQPAAVLQPSLLAMRNRVRDKLIARATLAEDVAAGRAQPLSVVDRAKQLAVLSGAQGFASSPAEAKELAAQILRDELEMGIVVP